MGRHTAPNPPEARPRGGLHIEWGLMTRFPAENGEDTHSTPAGGPGSTNGPPYRPKPTRSRPPRRGLHVEWGLMTRFPAENGEDTPTRHPRVARDS